MKKCTQLKTGVALVAAAVSGCSDAAAPEDSGVYVLRSISGNDVPAVFRENDFTTLHILADTLVLFDDGFGRETWLFESVDKSDGSTHSYADKSELEYTESSGRIEIAYKCDDLALCIAPPHLVGFFTGSGLEFDVSLGFVPLVFDRTGGD